MTVCCVIGNGIARDKELDEVVTTLEEVERGPYHLVGMWNEVTTLIITQVLLTVHDKDYVAWFSGIAHDLSWKIIETNET